MAEQLEHEFRFRRGTKFGPVEIQLGPLKTGGTVDLSGGAYIRLRSGNVTRDSTVANGEIVVDDVAKKVLWTILEDETVLYTAGSAVGELICIDGAGEDQDPLRIVAKISERIPEP